jgi:RNA polymerase sigma-70 factor (ECF subfamily)
MGQSVCESIVVPVAEQGRHPEQVFRELVTQHQSRLYRFVYKHIGHAAEAEELAQQAFVEAARTYAQFRGDSQLSTWLYGIAMNLVRNHLSRAPQRRYRFEDEEALDQVCSESADPQTQLEHRQLVQLLEQELAELMPEMREVLLLVALDDLSYDEAAALLDVPIGTVRSRVSRARSQLRQRFQSAGVTRLF